jgi:hypothetical protein
MMSEDKGACNWKYTSGASQVPLIHQVSGFNYINILLTLMFQSYLSQLNFQKT